MTSTTSHAPTTSDTSTIRDMPLTSDRPLVSDTPLIRPFIVLRSFFIPRSLTRARPLARAIAALRPDPWRLALAVVTGSGALAMTIALMGTSGWLISRAAQQPPVLYLMVAVVAVRAFGIGRGVLRYCERLAAHDVALRGVVSLRETLFIRLAAAEPNLAAGLRRGDLLARLGSDVQELGDVVVRSLLPFATAALTSALSVLALTLVLPEAGAVLAAGLLIGGIAAPALAAVASRRAVRDTAAARSAMSSQVVALLDGLPELSVAGAAQARLDRLDQADDSLSQGLDRAARPAAWSAALATAAMLGTVLGCLMVGVQAVSAGRMAPVLLAVVTLVPLAVAEVVAALPAAAAGLIRAGAAAERVVELLDAPAAVTPAVGVSSHEVRQNGAPVPGVRADGVPVDGVRPQVAGLTCGWPGRPPALSGVDLDLAPGRRIAIVGPSGGGKTTLLLTLAGLLPAVTGRTQLDTCHGTVNLAADDAHIFTTTVRENLRLVRPDAEDGEIRSALDRAGLRSWLAGLPADLDTMISDPSGPQTQVGQPRIGQAQVGQAQVGQAQVGQAQSGQAQSGRPVSGGERRRLIVARSLLSGASLLLVDEPAEHLDPATADALVDELFTGAATVVVVTHRLSPLHLADEILVVADGAIAARGTHDWLIANHLPYREAWLAECARAVPRNGQSLTI